jgi:hypothetical protein
MPFTPSGYRDISLNYVEPAWPALEVVTRGGEGGEQSFHTSRPVVEADLAGPGEPHCLDAMRDTDRDFTR